MAFAKSSAAHSMAQEIAPRVGAPDLPRSSVVRPGGLLSRVEGSQPPPLPQGGVSNLGGPLAPRPLADPTVALLLCLRRIPLGGARLVWGRRGTISIHCPDFLGQGALGASLGLLRVLHLGHLRCLRCLRCLLRCYLLCCCCAAACCCRCGGCCCIMFGGGTWWRAPPGAGLPESSAGVAAAAAAAAASPRTHRSCLCSPWPPLVTSLFFSPFTLSLSSLPWSCYDHQAGRNSLEKRTEGKSSSSLRRLSPPGTVFTTPSNFSSPMSFPQWHIIRQRLVKVTAPCKMVQTVDLAAFAFDPVSFNPVPSLAATFGQTYL